MELYEKNAKSIVTRETIPQHASEFHMRYFWQDKIKFRIINPEVDSSWIPPPSGDVSVQTISIGAKLRLFILNLLRCWLSQRGRNAGLDILPLMRCPKCFSEDLQPRLDGQITCNGCEARYEVADNLFKFL